MSTDNAAGAATDVRLEGRLDAFGFAPAIVHIRATARPPRWRATRAALALGATAVITPLVGLVPPHIPWALTALIGGIVLTRRRLAERYTLRSMDASCPRCGTTIAGEPGRLRAESSVSCPQCHLQFMLRVPLP
jgi:hypothetical protein